MKRILLPTDFSENSWNAISYALQLFKDQTCAFTLLNTYTPIIYQLAPEQLTVAQFRIEDVMKEASKNGLEKLQQRIYKDFKNSKHTFSRVSAFNTLQEEINELYNGNMMDMIIMGTQGASGVKEILFGSNTMHIINNTKCPVLAIPSAFDFDSPHEILFPSDYQIDFQEKHVESILNIAKLFHARVNILHVSTNSELSIEEQHNKEKLGVFFKDATHLFHNVRNTHIPDAISEFQLKKRINLLAMINNKHSFFENLFFKSNIKYIGFHLNIPFLVIPSSI